MTLEQARHQDIADVLKPDASGKTLFPGNPFLLDIGLNRHVKRDLCAPLYYYRIEFVNKV